LYEVIRDSDDAAAEQAIKKFIDDMKERGQLALLPEILKEMPAAIKTVEGIEDVTIESAHDIDEQTVLDAVKALGKTEDKVEVTRIKNPELIGGIKIRGRDTVIDATLKGRLMKLRDAFAKPVSTESRQAQQ